jgi:hypothetical protein
LPECSSGRGVEIVVSLTNGSKAQVDDISLTRTPQLMREQ